MMRDIGAPSFVLLQSAQHIDILGKKKQNPVLE